MAMLKIAILSTFQYQRHIVMHEKAKFVCFIYMQPQKMKFKFLQINMKQVSYRLSHEGIIVVEKEAQDT